MNPNNRYVFAGYAIAVGHLADFLCDVWRVDHCLPRAIQEAERSATTTSGGNGTVRCCSATSEHQ